MLAKALSQFGSIGLLVLALAGMGCVSGERRSGAAAMLLVKPVSRTAYLLAKWSALLALSLVSFAAGYAAAWVLYGAVDRAGGRRFGGSRRFRVRDMDLAGGDVYGGGQRGASFGGGSRAAVARDHGGACANRFAAAGLVPLQSGGYARLGCGSGRRARICRLDRCRSVHRRGDSRSAGRVGGRFPPGFARGG
ncbi:ABC transporter permease [Paenibacillus thermoaerophilus]|nr:ABC transporter permease [Paenibacillus thermoaerophilus]